MCLDVQARVVQGYVALQCFSAMDSSLDENWTEGQPTRISWVFVGFSIQVPAKRENPLKKLGFCAGRCVGTSAREGLPLHKSIACSSLEEN